MLFFLGLGVSAASAALVDPALYDWAFNVNGTVHGMPVDGTLPSLSGFDLSDFDSPSGVGTITYSFTAPAAGSYSVYAFFDHEISQSRNTFYNEYGTAVNSPAPGQSWEIDEPGYRDPNPGDGFVNFVQGRLDNANALGIGMPDDVSIAMGWQYFLDPGDTARILFILGENAPPSGSFFTSHYDGESGEELFLHSSLNIEEGSPAPVSEPGTMMLLGSGIVGLLAWR